MAQEISLTQENGRVYMATPYNRDFIAEIKQIGGRWDADGKQWHVAEENKDKALEVLKRIFDYVEGNSETVTIHVDCSEYLYEKRLVIGGTFIAERRYRDMLPVLGKNVIVESGRFPSGGGSIRNPELQGRDVILKVTDFPRATAEALEQTKDSGVSIVDGTRSEREKLEAELKTLQARIAEINHELAALNENK